ncbi:MAG: TrkA family potassium uptake protein [Phycisphaerae bacterium]|nr:TrkA family potassium uptake protein [Phycisphaerae bacterium]
MQNYAIIGLGQFGKCILESLLKRKCDVVVIDHDDKKVQWASELSSNVVKADALNPGVITELFPKGLHCAIIDLGEHWEPSILVTNRLQKLKVPNIVVQALSPAHAEILQMVGATKVIFPEREAAERLAGLLLGRGMLDYFPVSDDFSVVERPVPPNWVGKKLTEMDLRRKREVHVVGFRRSSVGNDRWYLPDVERPFESQDIVLLAGATATLNALPTR